MGRATISPSLRSTPLERRIWALTAVLCLFFIGTAWALHSFDRQNATPLQRPLEELPQRLGTWRVVQEQSLRRNVAEVLDVDDYVLRTYQDEAANTLNLYVSYFSYLAKNKGYHSPLNCMPGSGWEIVSTTTVAVPSVGEGPDWTINRTLLQKGGKSQVMLYWYQGRGRVISNEYAERMYRVLDSIFLGRTDGAFVRLVSLQHSGGSQSETQALVAVAQRLIPQLQEFFPQRETGP
ncbi:MAG: exosortase C-terminal domain/associated protein EpsI [Thermodesulfobacteriota bacterium]